MVALVLLGLAVIVAVAVPRIRAVVRGRVADLAVALRALRSPSKIGVAEAGYTTGHPARGGVVDDARLPDRDVLPPPDLGGPAMRWLRRHSYL
jgi:hypothetical protein